jgi:hypothetical protein
MVWFFWILIGLIIYAAFKTNPDEASFQRYLEANSGSTSSPMSNTSSNSNVRSWLKRNVLGKVMGSNQVSFQRKDFFVCSMATLKDAPHTTFLGLFGMWLLVSKTVYENDVELGNAESSKNMAHQYKAKNDSTSIITIAHLFLQPLC